MKIFLYALTLSLISATAQSAENSEHRKIYSVETRESGVHAVYFNGPIPSQNCTFSDRAVIVDTGDNGAKAMLDVALFAMAGERFFPVVVVRVDGCTAFNPPSPDTAPRAVRLQVYKNSILKQSKDPVEE